MSDIAPDQFQILAGTQILTIRASVCADLPEPGLWPIENHLTQQMCFSWGVLGRADAEYRCVDDAYLHYKGQGNKQDPVGMGWGMLLIEEIIRKVCPIQGFWEGGVLEGHSVFIS